MRKGGGGREGTGFGSRVKRHDCTIKTTRGRQCSRGKDTVNP